MDKPDYQPFVQMLDAVYALHGKSLNAEAKALFFRAMAQFPLPMVRAALDAHVRDQQRGQYPPKPADLIAQIEAMNPGNGRLGAEEAWSRAVLACDETETVVMNDQIAEAWGIAKPIFDLGDEVGARMAFKEAYARVTATSTTPAKWWPSIGSDPHKRDAALSEAKRAGLLPAPQVAALLPPARPTKATASPEGLQRLKAEMERLRLKGIAEAEAMEVERQRARDMEGARKRQIAAQVAAYQGSEA